MNIIKFETIETKLIKYNNYWVLLDKDVATLYDVDGMLKIIDNSARMSPNFDANNPNSSIFSAPYRIYNIGNSFLVQLLDFIKTLEKAIGKYAIKNFMDMQEGDVASTYADVSDLINDFGYKPYTSIEVGIERFVN